MPKAQAQAMHRKAQEVQRQQRQQLSLIGIVTVVVVVFFGLFMLILNRAGGSVQIGKYDQLGKANSDDGLPILGDPRTKLMIVEFSDFGCPYCLAYKPTLNDIIDKYVRTGQARLVFATQMFHQNSDVASQAALCANKQGKFWEMHDALFDIQSRDGLTAFTVDNLKRTAETLGVDGKKWLDCVASGETQAPLASAYKLFQTVNADVPKDQSGTPTLMWSDDGKTWKRFTNEAGQAITSGGVSLNLIDRLIATYYQTHQ